MIELNNRCSATKVQITNDHGAVAFKCPACSNSDVIRSANARQLVTKYTCVACGFTGPN